MTSNRDDRYRIRKKLIYDFIQDYNTENGKSPTMSEISKGLSINSTDAVNKAIQSLCKENRLYKIGHGRYAVVYPDKNNPAAI